MTKYVSFIRVFPCQSVSQSVSQSVDRKFTDVTLVVSDDNCGDDEDGEDGEDDQDDQDNHGDQDDQDHQGDQDDQVGGMLCF